MALLPGQVNRWSKRASEGEGAVGGAFQSGKNGLMNGRSGQTASSATPPSFQTGQIREGDERWAARQTERGEEMEIPDGNDNTEARVHLTHLLHLKQGHEHKHQHYV